MIGSSGEMDRLHPLIDHGSLGKSGLIKAGLFSLVLHIPLLLFLINNLKPPIPKVEPTVCQVTIRPVHPPSDRAVQKKTWRREVEWKDPASDKKIEQRVLHASQPVMIEIPLKDKKQTPLRPDEEETLKEPIALPMAIASPSDTGIDIESEGPLPVFSSDSNTGQELMSGVAGAGSGEGAQGTRGSGTGPGSGDGSPGWGETGDGPRLGRRLARGGGLLKGTGIGPGGSGWGEGGNGSGSGLGRGGSGGAKSEYGGMTVPHAGNGGNPKPFYPQEARQKGFEGEVLLRVEVLSNGRVGQAEVRESSGHEVLDQSALAAVKQWRFIPARMGGVPIPFWVNIPIKFQLM